MVVTRCCIGKFAVWSIVSFITVGAEARVEDAAAGKAVGLIGVLAVRSCKRVFARALTGIVDRALVAAVVDVRVLAVLSSVPFVAVSAGAVGDDLATASARSSVAELALGPGVRVGGGGALEAVGAVAVEDALACIAADARVANAGTGRFVDRRAQAVAKFVRVAGFARRGAVGAGGLVGVVWAGRAGPLFRLGVCADLFTFSTRGLRGAGGRAVGGRGLERVGRTAGAGPLRRLGVCTDLLAFSTCSLRGAGG